MALTAAQIRALIANERAKAKDGIKANVIVAKKAGISKTVVTNAISSIIDEVFTA